MDESNVFRSVLSWARHQTDTHTDPNQWTNEERSRIISQLSGVINHIRFLLIDSQVFAQEVEPTGIVPIEITLERYRYAALANGKHHPQNANSVVENDKQMTPRLKRPGVQLDQIQLNMAMSIPTLNRYFNQSTLLVGNNAQQMEQLLNEWYCLTNGSSENQQWTLIYRASAHDFTADSFHAHCDGVGPTYIIVLATSGWLSGAFTDVEWSKGSCGPGGGRGKYVQSEASFLFTLQRPGGLFEPLRFDIKKKLMAVVHHAQFGPVFGGGADLSIADKCHLGEENYSNLPHSYDGAGAGSGVLFGDYNFTVHDYEVFTPVQRRNQ